MNEANELEYSLNRAGKNHDFKKNQEKSPTVQICYVRQKNPNSMGDEVFAVILDHTITQNHTRQLMDAYNKYHTSIVSIKTVTADD